MAGTNQPTRRDFLHGRVIAGLAGDVARIFDDETPASVAASLTSTVTTRRTPLTSFRRRAMACEFEVQLAAADAGSAADAVLAAFDLVEALEDQLTIYRADSEIIRINRHAAERPTTVESRLFALLEMAARLHRETGGALDLTTGPLSDAWGFSRRQGRLPSNEEFDAALQRVGMDKLLLDPSQCTIAFHEQGVSLHLNCIGKGYAIDRMAELLEADSLGAAVGNYLIHGGSSSVLARGTCPGHDRSGWTIGVPHPLRPGERLGEIDLVDEALGTSGSATQSFEHKGQRYGHLLDPRTGRPVTGIYSAIVVAPSAAEADALSTAFYVMGPDNVARFCATHPGIGAILICPGEPAGEVRLHAFGIEIGRWRPQS